MRGAIMATLLAGTAALGLSAYGTSTAAPGTATSPAPDPATVWTVDRGASRIGFDSAFAGSPVRGQFKAWTAQITFDPERPERSFADIEVEIGSAATGADEVDAGLLGADWFAASLFPKARFRTTAIRRLSGQWYEVDGQLSIRDRTQPLTMPLRIMIEGDVATCSGSITVDRSLFGVGRGQWQSGDSVPLQVRVSFDIRAGRRGASVPAGMSGSPATAAASPAPAAQDEYRPTPAFANQTRAPAPATPSRFKVEVLSSKLDRPWSMAFLPDGGILVTERPGTMRILGRDGRLSDPIAGVPPVKAVAAEGLHDVVLDPDFSRSRRIYFSYFAPLPNDKPFQLQDYISWLGLPVGEHEKQPFGYERVAAARLSDDGTRLEDVKVVVEGGNRRLAFAPDGSLFVTAAPPAGGGIPVDMEPQRLSNSYGKVLRVRSDGSVPPDNPFVRRKDVLPSIYAYGLRDMEGAAVHPRTGRLWTLEHGPRGGDEINLIQPGRNYGFPVIGYGREYSGALINGGKTRAPGMEQPRYFWTPSIAPSGLAFYTGALFPEWRNSLFVGAMVGKRLIRLELNGDRVVAEEPLLADRNRRVRDVRSGPDGALYVLTDGPGGELLRLTPP